MTLLQEGDVIELKSGHSVYASVPQKLVFDNTPRSKKLTEHLVVLGSSLDSAIGGLAGYYLVTKAFEDGSGVGHGPHDSYPDGWKVVCERLSSPNQEVSFYQTGSFTAMILKLPTIGKAQKKWILPFSVKAGFIEHPNVILNGSGN